MEINLELRLPRDTTSVPAARRLFDSSLAALGVDESIRGDIELMLTEACTNVIRHARAGDDYTVRATIVDERCVIRVIDSGRGVDQRIAEAAGKPASHTAESGRGLQIMRVLADDMRFHTFPDRGSLVALEKHLSYREGSFGSRLSEADWSTENGSIGASNGCSDGPLGARELPSVDEIDPELQEFATRLFTMARTGRTDDLVPYLKAGVPPNLSNEKGDTLLMLAAYHGHADTVRALVEHGADPERANDRGQRPLPGAVFKKEPTVVRALLDAGADPWAGDPSAVETAKTFGHNDLLALFEKTGERRPAES
ncbi:ATP-binding protein [Actinomadura oligospora]|uniref:ATP-binding protein n=1 Tax=Actinomadura oligospora TaxID=111804 RepID=UPI0004B42B0E